MTDPKIPISPDATQLMKTQLTDEHSLDAANDSKPARQPDGKASPLPGASIIAERFCLEEIIGESTFGEVWKARDMKLDRDVALKFLKAGVGGRKAMERFELEQQILARMSHPGIADVFDGGIAADGRPFLAMEFLPGSPLSTFCNAEELSVDARLTLFVTVCRAVHHAHQNRVIHLDLKPANILVVKRDGEAVPKVIDFGIARVANTDEFTAASGMNFSNEHGGTPHYMSPEQAAGAMEISALSDVYSLGVILYELLTGQPPFLNDAQTMIHLLGAIQTKLPDRPSLRLDTILKRTPVVSAQRRTDGRSLMLKVTGDLDAIVMRAMEKVPSSRYDSAAALADDVERHLRWEPVVARNGGGYYRLDRWVRRNRAKAAAIAVVIVAAFGTGAGFARAYFIEKEALIRESNERKNAEVARDNERVAKGIAIEEKKNAIAARDAEEVARKVAVRARSEAEDLLNYMLYDLREQLEPLGRTRLLDSVSAKAEDYFEHQPANSDDDALERNRAVMFYNRGRILLAQERRLGDAAVAFEKSRELMEKRLGKKTADAARSLDLARALDGLGLTQLATGKLPECRATFERQLALTGTATSTEAVLLRATAHERLGDCALRSQDFDAAMQHFTEQEKTLRALYSTAHEDRAVKQSLAIACEKLATVHEQQGRFEDSLKLYQEETRLLQQLAANAPGDLVIRRRKILGLGRMGSTLVTLKRSAEALPHLEDAAKEAAALAAVDSANLELQRELAAAYQRLGVVQRETSRFDAALESSGKEIAVIDALVLRDSERIPFQQDAAIARGQRAMTHLARGATSEAKADFLTARDALQKLAGKLDPAGERWLSSITTALSELQKIPETKRK